MRSYWESPALPIWGMEAYFSSRSDIAVTQDINKLFSERAGRAYDSRTPLEVIADEHASGRKVLPNYPVNNIPFTHPKTGPMFVRGTVAGSRVLGENEIGTYTFFQVDERGFKNPLGLWDASAVDAFVVGDSFVHGAGVPIDKDIVGSLRNRHPISLNLGESGIGPLYYYQMIVEYAAQVKPDFVAFVWYEGNDITDLIEEKNTPLLAKYIGRTSPLGLFDIQDALMTIIVNGLAYPELT